MRFKGQLLIPAEPGPGLSVDLEVVDQHLAVVSDGGKLGAWPLDAVSVRRLQGDTFAMTVAGEDLHFVADDTISFAYDGIQAIEKTKSGMRMRSPFRGLKGLFGFSTDPVVEPEPGLAGPQSTTTGAAIVRESEEPGAPSSAPVDQDNIPDEIDLSFPLDSPPQDLDEKVDQAKPTYEIEIEDWLTRPRNLRGAVTSPAPIESETPRTDIGDTPDLEDVGTGEPRCKAIRNDGQPCQSPIVGDSGYCYPHDPENPVGLVVQDAHEARNRLKQKRANRLSRVYGRLDRALKQLEQGEINTDQAMAMAQLARTMCAILELDETEESDSNEERPFFT